MRSFSCGHCGLRVYFDNFLCLRCRSPLGYVFADRAMLALTETSEGYVELGARPTLWYRCTTTERTGCNWLVAHPGGMCASCTLTRTRPADDDPTGLEELVAAEAAKRRLVHQLAELGLRPLPRNDGLGTGVAFDLLSSSTQKVVTGHADGVITLDLAEADEAHRTRMQQQMREPYRTLLGHFRHEIGHYYWTVLVDGGPHLGAYRALFGDERAGYREAIDRHYRDGAPEDWGEAHVSAYATMHPWEDWAETFAHYLHIRDAMQTADAHGVLVTGPTDERTGRRDPLLAAVPEMGLAPQEGMVGLIAEWLPLTYALNAVNRSMGKDDLYPFVLPKPVIEKLEMVHARISEACEAVSSA